MGLDPAVAAVRRAIRDDVARTPGGAVLVACSGGADSLALLAGTVFEARKSGWHVVGVTVDHGLQDGSADHAARVVAQMVGIGAHETVSIRVSVEATGVGPEAAAREARYAVLGEVAERFGSSPVLLGHTRDDQAETVLMGLSRGSGARSLSGMRRSFDRYRRPLLDITRAQTEAACVAEGIEFWTDPHNSDPRFLRSRVRHTVLPMLEAELGPGIAATLARTADQLRDDTFALDEMADRVLREVDEAGEDADHHLVRTGWLETYPAAIISRVLRTVALEAGCPPSELFAVHIDAMFDLVYGHGRRGIEIQLPGKVTAYRDGAHLRFRPTAVAG